MAKKKIKEKQTELVYGLHPILELLKAKRRRLVQLYTIDPKPKSWRMLERYLPKGLQIQYVKKDVLNRLAYSTDHQSLVGYATPFTIRKKFFEPAKQPFLLMLDGIQDPRNLGAILRSAYCTNVSGVIITKKQSSPLTPTAIKASAGLAEHLDIFLAPSAQSAMQDITQTGYTPYLAVLGKAENALTVEYQKPLCLVIGNEGSGVSTAIKKSGQLITLPQKTPDISYNASVASGILLFWISQKTGAI